MADQTKLPPIKPRAEAERVARQAREAAALRENLRKRRQQTQIRRADPPAPKA